MSEHVYCMHGHHGYLLLGYSTLFDVGISATSLSHSDYVQCDNHFGWLHLWRGKFELCIYLLLEYPKEPEVLYV